MIVLFCEIFLNLQQINVRYSFEKQGGLANERVKLALEPEAASLWCNIVTSEAHMALGGARTRHMVIDMGGTYHMSLLYDI